MDTDHLYELGCVLTSGRASVEDDVKPLLQQRSRFCFVAFQLHNIEQMEPRHRSVENMHHEQYRA